MKLGGTQSQEIKSVFASATEAVKTTSNNSSEAAHNNEKDAGSASKLGEFTNLAARTKQLLLAKAITEFKQRESRRFLNASRRLFFNLKIRYEAIDNRSFIVGAI